MMSLLFIVCILQWISLLEAGCPSSFSSWMTDHLSIIKNKKLSEISLPGSHDAGMYISKHCTIAGVGGPTDCNTRTQELTIANQLNCGIRYFDLRPVATDHGIITGHYSKVPVLGTVGCEGGDMLQILTDVLKFVESHSNELIILKFSHYYDRDSIYDGSESMFISKLSFLVEQIVDSSHLINLSKLSNVMDLTYEQIVKSGNVIVLYANELDIYDSYSNSNDFNTMKEDQFQKLNDYGNNKKRLFLLSWTLTQDSKQSAGCSFDPTDITNSIRSLSCKPNQLQRLNEISSYQTNSGKIANIIYTDFVDGSSTMIAAKTNGITTIFGAITCNDDDDCANCACARITAATDATKVCCPSGDTHLYAGYYYCTDMKVGDVCWSDAMCKTGLCGFNDGGLSKGTCFGVNLTVRAQCYYDKQCLNNACARITAAPNALKGCCPSGKTHLYAGYYYCTDMKTNDVCWSDAMCKSNTCKGNWWGTRRGKCT